MITRYLVYERLDYKIEKTEWDRTIEGGYLSCQEITRYKY